MEKTSYERSRMLHKVSKFCDQIKIIYQQSEKLREAKYEKRLSKKQIDHLIEDLQFQMWLLSQDKGAYKK